MDIDYKKLAGILLLVLIALFSMLLLGNDDSPLINVTIQRLEKRIDDSLALSSATAISSVAVTLLPSDIATPVAEKVVDLTEYFLIALMFLYSEKFAMSVLGFSVFKIIIPVACAIIAVLRYKKNEELKRITIRVVAFALILFFSIPISTKISDTIYTRYAVNIDEIVLSATTITSGENEQGESTGILDIISEKVTGAYANFTNRAGALLHGFVDMLAITISTCCIIPLLVLAFLLWVLNKLFGLKVQFPRPRHARDLKERKPEKDSQLPKDPQLPEEL